MSLSNMQVYNTEIIGTTIELLSYKTDLFNANSNGTLVLSSAAWRGDFTRESFYQQLQNARRRVNRYATNAAVASQTLQQAEIAGVKVAGGYGPVVFEPSQLTWLREDPATAIRVIAESFSDSLLEDQLNSAVKALIAAISGNTAMVLDESATGGVSLQLLNRAHAKFGDSSSLLRADLMTGAAYHSLIGKALDNSNQLFQAGNVLIQEVLGKRYIVSDIPALFEAGTPNKTKVLSLTANAAVVDNTSDVQSNISTDNGKERIETTWQADYTFGLKLKGYSWDTVNGGKSPTDAAIATAANWDKVVTSDKATAGVLAIADADQ